MKKSWRFYRVNLYSIYSHGAPSGNNALQTLNMSTMCQVASSHWGVPFVQAFTTNTVLAANNEMRAANIDLDRTPVSTDRHCNPQRLYLASEWYQEDSATQKGLQKSKQKAQLLASSLRQRTEWVLFHRAYDT